MERVVQPLARMLARHKLKQAAAVELGLDGEEPPPIATRSRLAKALPKVVVTPTSELSTLPALAAPSWARCDSHCPRS
jgi:hypothetical protein